MIIDKLTNAALYAACSPHFAQAFDFLQTADWKSTPPGKIEIAGGSIYALVQEYTVKPPAAAMIEAHRRYIDIQFIAAGRERIGYAPLEKLVSAVPYAAAEDCGFYSGTSEFLTLTAGMFAVFFPGDGHQPCVAVVPGETVKKVVVKVAV